MKNRRKNPVPARMLVRVLRAENRRLRDDLNDQTAYADEYHATMTQLYKELRNSPVRNMVTVGGLTLTRLKSGHLWLQIRGEEGMQVDEMKLQLALRGFMARHF